VLFGVQGGVSLVLYPFFQVMLGWSALLSTLGMMPMALLMMLAAGLAPRLASRAGSRATMVVGLTVATVGLALMAALVSPESGYVGVLPGLIAMGLGAGLAMTPSTEAITSALPPAQQGVASALNDLTRELGAALGIALLGGLLVAGYQTAIASRLDGVPSDLAAEARAGIANAASASEGAGIHAEQVLRAAQDAFIAGWQQAIWVGVAVMILLVVFVLFRGPERVTPGDDRATASESSR
jgi:MFS family permease